MGSGTSKSSKDSVKTGNSSAQPIQKQAVANVNKQEKQKTQNENKKDISSSSQINTKDSQSRDFDNERNTQNKSKSKNSKKTALSSDNSRLQFEEDSDINDDIDEVLKIPTAQDTSNKNKKDSKKQELDKENNYNYIQTKTQQDLPETYAQRLQRKQYKLQQDILIREKTIIRNSKDWEDDEDDDNSHSDKEMGSPNRFDASKFRAANMAEHKKEVFAVQDDTRTPRYMHSPDHNLDDIGVTRKDDAPLYKQTPRYDTDELDLMRQLEEELL